MWQHIQDENKDIMHFVKSNSARITSPKNNTELCKELNIKYPKNTPIKPGETGQILVSFDSNNKPNMQQKTVTISANTQSGRETLRIKAMVNADPVKQKQRDELAKARQQQNPN